ncbi:MAG: hypothetical protein M3173_00300, partial [Chloroflexota bacterium]|nr:hypothetical protein [Chloroflexota bacterium]
GAYRIAAEGQAVGDLLDELPDHAQEGHGWGSLGLPQGLETRVVASTTDGVTSDYAIARSSSSAVELEHHPTLKLAPGERVAIGACSGVVHAIDHRAGTIELQVDDGEYVIISIDELHGTGDQEQET